MVLLTAIKVQEKFAIKRGHLMAKDSFLYTHAHAKDTVVGKYHLRTGEYTKYSNVKLPVPLPISIDKNQVLWVGTDKGLYQLFDHTFINYDAGDFPLTWSIVGDREGKKWLASYPDGLYEWKNDKLKKIDTPHAGFHMGAIRTQGNDLIFPTDHGLYMYKNNVYSWLDSCQTCSSITIFEDVERNLIIAGGANSVKIYKDYQLDRIINEEQGLHPKGYFIALGKDKFGQLWFGSNTGISIYDYQSDKVVKKFTSVKGNLPSNGAITLFKDQYGEIWVGTESGLLAYDYDSDSFAKVFGQEINTQVSSIINMDDRHILVAAFDGLYFFDNRVFHRDSLPRLFKYNHQNGFVGIEPIHNSLYKDKDGIIWIPCQSHLVSFDPKGLEFSENPLHLRISEINGEKIRFLEETDTVQIEEKRDNIKLKFEASNLSSPFTVLYSYKLDGHEKEWSKWQEEATAEYSDLRHGEHNFHVRAKVGYYGNKTAIASKTIRVNLGWWQRNAHHLPWVACFFAIGTLVFTILWLYNKHQRKKALRKNAELSRLYDLQTLESRLNPHFVFNALTSIQRQVIFAEKEKVEDFIVRFSVMLRNFFDLKENRSSKGINPIERIPLKDEISFIENYVRFQQQLSKNFEYRIEIGEEVNEYEEMIPPMFIQPFVENAIYHGFGNIAENKEPYLKLTFKEENGIVCTISDNGEGITNFPRGEINFRDFNVASQNSQILQKRVQALANLYYTVNITIKSSQNIGTTVKIKFKENGKNQSIDR